MKPVNLRHFLLAPLLFCLFISACSLGEASKKKASYHFQMGMSYLNENNFTSALVELNEAEKLNPDDPQLQNNLGIVYFRKNKFELAEKKYLRALELKPDYSDARNNLAVDYLEMKRWDDAIYHLKIVSDDIFFQEQELATTNLGLAYFGKGDYPKALSVLRAVVASSPNNIRARVNLGKVYLALDKVELAIMEFNRAVEINKNYATAYYQLALAYLKVKDTPAALTAFREVVRIAPETEIGRNSREYLDLLK